MVLLPLASLSQHNDSICPKQLKINCSGNLDTIKLNHQQTIIYLLEIIKGLGMKPDSIKLEK